MGVAGGGMGVAGAGAGVCVVVAGGGQVRPPDADRRYT